MRDPLFIIYNILWWFIHICRWVNKPIPYLNNWLTDFLFIPVVAHLTKHIALRREDYRFPLSYLLVMALYTALIFEWVYPSFSHKTVGDPLDGIAYLLGSLFYYYVHQDFRLGRIFR
ncbi:hypothetical protein [Chitinophaga sp.]|uniref:hypothetical protein n=1 Tax=Chitinophaga sp. TaxID=1869181 RepID=UPI0031D8358F